VLRRNAPELEGSDVRADHHLSGFDELPGLAGLDGP
jgi:hypothetical protein